MIVCFGSDPVLRDSPRFFALGNLLCWAQRPGSARSGRLNEYIERYLLNETSFYLADSQGFLSEHADSIMLRASDFRILEQHDPNR